jgi:hypothetical protein
MEWRITAISESIIFWKWERTIMSFPIFFWSKWS